MVRSRSTSRSRVVKKSDLFPGGEALNPHALLEDVLKHVKDTSIPLSVDLTDGNVKVSYNLNTFLSRDYEVVDGYVKFGFRRMLVNRLSAKIGFDIHIGEDSDDTTSTKSV